MSIEKLIQENTAALRALTEVLAKLTHPAVAIGNPADITGTPDGRLPDGGYSAPPEKATKAAVEPTKELVYADIQKPFLKLVGKSRDKAVAYLKGRGWKTLQEAKPATFAEVLAEINALLGEG